MSEVVGENAGKRVWPFLMDRVSSAQHNLDLAPWHGRGEAPCRRYVAVVELARHEGAWHADAVKVVPQRLHHAGAHAAQRAREAGDVVLEALGAKLRNVAFAAPLQAGEEGKRTPVIDEGLDPIFFEALGQGLVAAATPLACVTVEPGVRADGQERKQPLRPSRASSSRPAWAPMVSSEATRSGRVAATCRASRPPME